MDFSEFEDVAHRLADAAATATLPHFRAGLAVENKLEGAFDPVTAADRDAERAIRDLIFNAYPDHGLLGEEFGVVEGASAYQWVVDPIDGTRAFVSGIPLWTTIIGLRHEGVPVFGMVDQPYIGDRFWGGAGRAAFRPAHGREGHAQGPIAPRACATLSDAILMTTFTGLFDPQTELDRYLRVERAVRLVRYSADAYAYCMVASGQIDLVVESKLEAYDIVGLVPIIEGAGGIITDWQGDPIRDGGTAVAAGDPRVHAETLALLNA